MERTLVRKFLSALALALAAVTSRAAPVEVSYTVSGSTGDWLLDFSVANNLNPAPANMSLYFFGVLLSAPDIVGSPAGYDPTIWPSWNTQPDGGSDTNYNNNWINLNFDTLFPGETLSGFEVHSTDGLAPTNVPWFAYGYAFEAEYTGGGNFSRNGNPGFEGVALQAESQIPEPASLTLVGLTLAALGGLSKRRRVVCAKRNR